VGGGGGGGEGGGVGHGGQVAIRDEKCLQQTTSFLQRQTEKRKGNFHTHDNQTNSQKQNNNVLLLLCVVLYGWSGLWWGGLDRSEELGWVGLVWRVGGGW